MMNGMNLSQKVWQDPTYFIAFGFGSGLMPIAPGTWGTLAAIPVYALLAKQTWYSYLLLTALAFVVGVLVCQRVSADLEVEDFGGIVWDEVVGYLLTMFWVPMNLYTIVIGFLAFRLFDIWKPQPIRWVEQRVRGGLGVMLDDVLAAIPAWLLLQALLKFY